MSCFIIHFKEETENSSEKNEQEHEAVSPDSYIPEVKTNSLYLAYPKSRLGGHLSTAQGLGKSFLTSKALTLGKCTKSASWELKLDPFKPQKDRSFFTEGSRGAAPRVTLTNSFGQSFWILLFLDNVDFLACEVSTDVLFVLEIHTHPPSSQGSGSV